MLCLVLSVLLLFSLPSLFTARAHVVFWISPRGSEARSTRSPLKGHIFSVNSMPWAENGLGAERVRVRGVEVPAACPGSSP
jgi:hypothetical protein